MAALTELIADVDLDMIQLRNLNIDPEVYAAVLPKGAVEPGMGTDRLMSALKSTFPHLRFGYFNPAKEVYQKWREEDGR